MQIKIKQTYKPTSLLDENVLKPAIFNPHINMYLNWDKRSHYDNKDLLLSNENIEVVQPSKFKRPNEKFDIIKVLNRPMVRPIARVE